MKKMLFLIPMMGLCLSSCNMISDTISSLENNRQAVDMSTWAIEENIQAIQQANQGIEENRRQLQAINQVLKKAAAS